MTSDAAPVAGRPAPIQPWDVLIVPFPFAERDAEKRRPALALSTTEFVRETGTVVVAMITSAAHRAWPGDVPITDLRHAGLASACVVRWKVATRDVRLVIRKAGSLSARDRKAAAQAMRRVMG